MASVGKMPFCMVFSVKSFKQPGKVNQNNCSRLDPGHLNLRKPFLGGGGGKEGEGTQRGKQQERSGTN